MPQQRAYVDFARVRELNVLGMKRGNNALPLLLLRRGVWMCYVGSLHDVSCSCHHELGSIC
jgi:hypothetical protein